MIESLTETCDAEMTIDGVNDRQGAVGRVVDIEGVTDNGKDTLREWGREIDAE